MNQNPPSPESPPHTRIKICGITNAPDGIEAVNLGADFIGIIFYPPSPRYLPPARAASLLAELRAHAASCGRAMPRVIGVFVDENPETIVQIRAQAGLDGVQFSGDEAPGAVRAQQPLRLRGMSLKTLDRLGRYEAEAYLCDTHSPDRKGGTGEPYDYDALLPHVAAYRIMVAGGLTPETVGGVVARLRPWGVDVSSGVEIAPGRKDIAKMRAFVEAVRRAQAVR